MGQLWTAHCKHPWLFLFPITGDLYYLKAACLFPEQTEFLLKSVVWDGMFHEQEKLEWHLMEKQKRKRQRRRISSSI